LLLACVRQWQSNLEPRPFAEFALHLDMPAVVANNAIADSQAEARTFADLFGGEEGIVNFGEMGQALCRCRIAEIDEH
jgi:hypothetical protein